MTLSLNTPRGDVSRGGERQRTYAYKRRELHTVRFESKSNKQTARTIYRSCSHYSTGGIHSIQCRQNKQRGVAQSMPGTPRNKSQKGEMNL